MKTLQVLLDAKFNTSWFSRVCPEEAYKLTSFQDELLCFLEASFTLLYDMRRSQGALDISVSFASFFRSVTGRSATGSMATLLTDLSSKLGAYASPAQSSSWIDVLDDLHKNVHRVKDSTVGRKIISVLNHVVAHTFYYKMGLEIDSALYHKIEKSYIRLNLWNVASFADALTGLLLFLAKAGRQALLTGSAEPFYVDSTTISDWLLKANRLRKDAEFLGNPQAIGLDTPMYLRDVEDAIEEGHLFKRAFGDLQKTTINSVILELELVLKRHKSSLAASSFRFCPFGVNLYGDSGVGKSFLAKGLFNHYCSVRGIPKEKAILYPRGPDDPFYSQFKSSMPGIIFDDVAKHKSSKVMGIDQSLSDIISVCNNIPMLTNQAELADKGKVPLLCEWMGITSNIENLSVEQYYVNTYAVLRRMPYRIEPIVKPEFRKAGTTGLDSSKVPTGEQYPDCWTFRVCSVVRHENGLTGCYQDRMQGTVYNSYADLLAWLTIQYAEHIENQEKLIKAVSGMGPERLCACLLPHSICSCRDGPAIAYDAVPLPPVQAQASSDLQARMTVLFAQKRKIQEHGKSLAGLEQLFNTRWLEDDFQELLTHVVNADAEVEVDLIFNSYLGDFRAFMDLPIREQSVSLMRVRDSPPDDDSYLSFIPTRGGACSYSRKYLKELYLKLQPFVAPFNWTAPQLAALEVYMYEKVPGYVSAGWDEASIFQGAVDFVDTHEHLYRDVDVSAREFLLAEPTTTWKEKCCRWLGVQYLSRPWLYKSGSYLSNTRLGKWFLSDRVSWFQVQALHAAADTYNNLLEGQHRVVLMVVAACAMASLWVFVKSIMDRYVAQPQISVHTVGRKPIVRADEKANVWVTAERAITNLDFHPKRPNNRTQLDNLLGHNVKHFTFRAPGVASGSSTCIIADNQTIVMNAHCVFFPMRLTIHLGRKVDEGVSPTLDVEVTADMVRFMPERDLAVVKTLALPATFKDIRKCFPMRSFSGEGVGTYHIVRDVETVDIPVYGVQRVTTTIPLSRTVTFSGECFTGKPKDATRYGDCGSPLIMETARGPIVAGIHSAFTPSQGISFAVPVYYEDLDLEEGLMVQVDEVAPCVPVAQSTTDDEHDYDVSTKPSICALVGTDKLYSSYHQEGTLATMGQLKGFRPRFKASGRHSLIAGSILRSLRAKRLGVTDRLYQPVMSGWAPMQNILKEYLCPTHSISERLFRVCITSFSNHLTSGLSEVDVEDVHPVTIDVAVNGYPGVPNVDAQKFSTAAGHGMPGPKQAYVEFDGPFEEWSRCRKYNLRMRRAVSRILHKAARGIRSHPIFTAHLKDEMVSLRKVEAQKTRGFYMCPADYLTAMRMYTMGLTRVMVRRRSLFRIAVGLNTHSEEWEKLFQESEEIPGENWMAGDFVGFDKILSILIQNGASLVICAVAKHCGYNDEEMIILKTFLADTITPSVDFFGELIVLLGGEVSGHQLTTFFNCICNVLLHLYAWVVLAEERGEDPTVAASRFWSEVFICVLGDDIMAKISPLAPWYNHTSVQRVFESIGIQYTMADKTSVSRPYISLEEVTFLKRQFLDHDTIKGMKVAPLEKDSIYKMLLYTIPSRSEVEEVQLAQACASALSEAFYHGSDFYEEIFSLIEESEKTPEFEARLKQVVLPSYAECYARFVRASPLYRATAGEPARDRAETPQTRSSYCLPSDVVAQTSWSVDSWGSTTMERSSEESDWTGIRLSPITHHKPRRNKRNDEDGNLHLTKNTHKNQDFTTGTYGQMASVSAETAINKFVNRRRRRVKEMRWKGIVPQSSLRPDTEGNVNTTQQLYTFQAEPDHQRLDMSGSKNSVASKQTMSSSLAEYMSRPELVHTFTWNEGASFGVGAAIPVWELAMTPAKREKLSGFGLFRANLCVKFVVNGSPFYYGAITATYTPLIGWRNDTATTPSPALNLILNSQKPHVWLNVQNTSTAEMKIPFLFPYPHINTNLIDNFGDLGKLEYIIYVPLASANGATGTAVDIQMFTWFEDVELTGPTNLPVAQSSVEYENDHQISGPAAAVSSVAGMLANVPIIGPYAMATSQAAGMVSTVANALGFTNVPNISDVNAIKSKPFSLASADISEPIEKLSLASKQETTISMGAYGGTDEDELHLQRFCGRESFIAASAWSTSLAPATPLFTSGVTPIMHASVGAACAASPMTYASTAFQYWRGSIKFTIKAIRSKYHRGRIQFSWDRSAGNLNQGPVLGNANTMAVVLDLDEGDEVSLVVPYQQQSLFLPTQEYVTATGFAGNNWSVSSTPAGTGPGWNGVVSARVLTRLTAPEASSDITLLMMVSAGDDFELAAPITPRLLGNTTLTSLSPTNVTVSQSNVEYDVNAPTAASELTADTPEVYMDVFGEKIASLRTLLHRSSRAMTYVDVDTGSFAVDSMVMRRIPLKHLPPSLGFWNNAQEISSAPPNSRVNLTAWHPLPWFVACFAGYKGSVNVTVNNLSGSLTQSGYVDHMAISRVSRASALTAVQRRAGYSAFAINGSATTTATYLYANVTQQGASGLALTNTRTNAGLSANLPFYSPAAFYVADLSRTYNNQDPLSDANNDWWNVEIMYPAPSNVHNEPITEVFYGTGPDFNVTTFVNVPAMYNFAYAL
jgi:hypothetical protein